MKIKDDFERTAERPKDWPCNDREHHLDLMIDAFNRFRESPSFATKEVLVSLACQHDLNQSFSFGRHRIDAYEGALLNTLYLMSLEHNIASVRGYVYEHIARVTRLNKAVYRISEGIALRDKIEDPITAFAGLFPPLKLFYASYRDYTYNNDHELSYCLIRNAESVLESVDQEFTWYVQHAYVNLLNDISYTRGTKYDHLFQFSRDELKALFSVEFELLEKVGEDPSVRPLMGVLCTQISNLVLKSRNGYDDGPVVKYVPEDVAFKAALNHEVWIRMTNSLNDRREGALMREIVSEFKDPRYPWVKGVNTAPARIYDVCCFSRTVNDPVMKGRYGSCMYGFKNDRMVDLLSPIGKITKYRKESAPKDIPETIDTIMNAQIIAMDVLYGRDSVMQEFAYLCSIIDLMKVDGKRKQHFLEEIIQYWLYSVKDDVNRDGEWAGEKERRYVIFTYEGGNYINARREGQYLKIETSLYMFPDFILGNNPAREELIRRAYEKRTMTSTRDYVFCHDCLMRDYDAAISSIPPEVCPICKSRNIELVPVMSRRLRYAGLTGRTEERTEG